MSQATPCQPSSPRIRISHRRGVDVGCWDILGIKTTFALILDGHALDILLAGEHSYQAVSIILLPHKLLLFFAIKTRDKLSASLFWPTPSAVLNLKFAKALLSKVLISNPTISCLKKA
jgi:hypothetical protein